MPVGAGAPLLDLVLDQIKERLLPEILDKSPEARLDEMLRRLNAHDYLATLLLAELMLLETPDQGLATICRTEATAALAPLLEKPLIKLVYGDEPPSEPLSVAAEQLLARIDGCTPTAALLGSGADRVRCLHALHDLLRLDLVHAARSVTVLERANTMPAPSSK